MDLYFSLTIKVYKKDSCRRNQASHELNKRTAPAIETGNHNYSRARLACAACVRVNDKAYPPPSARRYVFDSRTGACFAIDFVLLGGRTSKRVNYAAERSLAEITEKHIISEQSDERMTGDYRSKANRTPRRSLTVRTATRALI